MIIAIDGPAGAGKSTVARALADRLGFRYVDTGAMYRSLTWLALQRGLPLGEGPALGDLARNNPITFDAAGRAFIAGCDVTDAIRQVRVDRMVPVVASHPEVREVMRERQRELAHEGDAVIEGRDIGTVVAPDAEVKVYLVADPSVRTLRRQGERPDIGADALATDLKLRDESDRVRMQRAADAEEIDTTHLAIEDVIARIEGLVRASSPRSR
jgi:cytidylate kinase